MQGPALAETLARLHEGKPESWTPLLTQLAPRLLAYFERLGIDHHLGEDLTQEVLATVYRKVDELRDPSRFAGWVRSIARNRMRSRMRRTRFTENLDEDAISSRDGMSRVYGDDLRRLVFEEVRRLSPAARRMLELKLLEERTSAEIATLMGIPRELFRRRFHVALKALRRRMEARMEGVARGGGKRDPAGGALRRSHAH